MRQNIAISMLRRSTRPTRGAQSPPPRDPRLSARNNVATRYLQKKQSLNGPPLTRSRRGNGFRGFPAAHPKPVFPSALFTLITTQQKREPATHETTSPLSYSAIFLLADDALHRQQAEHAQFMCIYLLRGISEYICHREHRRCDINQLFILTHRHAPKGFIGLFFA